MENERLVWVIIFYMFFNEINSTCLHAVVIKGDYTCWINWAPPMQLPGLIKSITLLPTFTTANPRRTIISCSPLPAYLWANTHAPGWNCSILRIGGWSSSSFDDSPSKRITLSLSIDAACASSVWWHWDLNVLLKPLLPLLLFHSSAPENRLSKIPRRLCLIRCWWGEAFSVFSSCNLDSATTPSIHEVGSADVQGKCLQSILELSIYNHRGKSYQT